MSKEARASERIEDKVGNALSLLLQTRTADYIKFIKNNIKSSLKNVNGLYLVLDCCDPNSSILFIKNNFLLDCFKLVASNLVQFVHQNKLSQTQPQLSLAPHKT